MVSEGMGSVEGHGVDSAPRRVYATYGERENAAAMTAPTRSAYSRPPVVIGILFSVVVVVVDMAVLEVDQMRWDEIVDGWKTDSGVKYGKYIHVCSAHTWM